MLIARGPHRLDDLEIREIRSEELPDLNAYREAFERIEPSKRVGKVAVPELKSARPPDPVYIEFSGPPDPKADAVQK